MQFLLKKKKKISIAGCFACWLHVPKVGMSVDQTYTALTDINQSESWNS